MIPIREGDDGCRFLKAAAFLLLFLLPARLSPADGITERASVSGAGAEGNGISARASQPAVDASGVLVAFDSEATNLVPLDANGVVVDVFVRHRLLGTTVLASVDSAGVQGNGASNSPSLSADGRFVAFGSSATNLAGGDSNGVADVFVHDLATGSTSRASVSSGGDQGDAASFSPSLSGDGRFVAFASDATNLVAGDTNGTRDVFVRDRLLGTTERVSVASDGTQANGFSAPPSLSDDGRFVAFGSFAGTLVPSDTNGTLDVFVHDRETRVTTRVSVDGAGNQADGLSSGASMSADGRFVAFFSEATNLVPDDTNATRDVFVHDRETGTTERVNVSGSGAEADAQSGFGIRGNSTVPRLSADGRFVSFDSFAANLVPGDANGRPDAFVRDRLLGTTVRVSESSSGAEGTDGSSDTAIGADGTVVAFASLASNLVPGDTNRCGMFQSPGQCPDVFAHTRIPCLEGSVNAGAGPVTDVLRVNGSAGLVVAAVGARIEIALGAAPGGPRPGRYVLWIWTVPPPTGEFEIAAGAARIGCTVHPTPLHRGLDPQPFRCVRGAGLPSAVCRGVRSLAAAPPSAPFTIARPRGSSRRGAFTLQGLLEDDGAAASMVRFSATNAVYLDVR